MWKRRSSGAAKIDAWEGGNGAAPMDIAAGCNGE